MNEQYRCVTCDGTGEIHSHNPKCYDCNGSGITDRATAEKEIRRTILPYVTKIKEFGNIPFTEKDKHDFVKEYLKKSLVITGIFICRDRNIK